MNAKRKAVPANEVSSIESGLAPANLFVYQEAFRWQVFASASFVTWCGMVGILVGAYWKL